MRARALPLVLLLILQGCAPTSPVGRALPGATADPALAEAPGLLVSAINTERQARGLPRLRTDGLLHRAAEIQAEQMAGAGALSHSAPGAEYPTLQSRLLAVGYTAAWAGEVLSAGREDPAAIVREWMASSIHRDVLLHPSATEIGVAEARSADGRPFQAAVLGRPK